MVALENLMQNKHRQGKWFSDWHSAVLGYLAKCCYCLVFNKHSVYRNKMGFTVRNIGKPRLCDK